MDLGTKLILLFLIVFVSLALWYMWRRKRILANQRAQFMVMSQDNSETWISYKLSDDFNEIRSLAVLAGHDSNNDDIFIGRAFKHGDWLPAKIIPKKNLAFVCWNGKEIYVDSFDILCGENYTWIRDRNGNVPLNAISPGLAKNGERLYIGRGQWYGSLTPGKIHPSHNCLYIPYHGKEIRIESYEVLCKIQTGPAPIGFVNQLDSMTDFNINTGAPVVVTSSTHTTAAGYVGSTGGYHEAPYPIANTSYPMPHPATTGHVNPPYPPQTAPYPMHTNTGMPMPQTTQGGGGYPHPQTGFQTTAPYPPANSDPQANPPSYDQVVGATAPYNKQSPYNPHYSG